MTAGARTPDGVRALAVASTPGGHIRHGNRLMNEAVSRYRPHSRPLNAF